MPFGSTGHINTKLCLWEARQRANDLITFYGGLKGFVRDQSALRMVDRILREEVRHFCYIERLLRSVADIRPLSSMSEL